MDDISVVELTEPAALPVGPAEPDERPRAFDLADEDSAGLLVAGVASAAVWLLVAVTVWRRVARRRSTS